MVARTYRVHAADINSLLEYSILEYQKSLMVFETLFLDHKYSDMFRFSQFHVDQGLQKSY